MITDFSATLKHLFHRVGKVYVYLPVPIKDAIKWENTANRVVGFDLDAINTTLFHDRDYHGVLVREATEIHGKHHYVATLLPMPADEIEETCEEVEPFYVDPADDPLENCPRESNESTEAVRRKYRKIGPGWPDKPTSRLERTLGFKFQRNPEAKKKKTLDKLMNFYKSEYARLDNLPTEAAQRPQAQPNPAHPDIKTRKREAGKKKRAKDREERLTLIKMERLRMIHRELKKSGINLNVEDAKRFTERLAFQMGKEKAKAPRVG